MTSRCWAPMSFAPAVLGRALDRACFRLFRSTLLLGALALPRSQVSGRMTLSSRPALRDGTGRGYIRTQTAQRLSISRNTLDTALMRPQEGVMTHTHNSGNCHEDDDLVRDFGGNGARPRLARLCGSTRYYGQFQQASYDLTLRGEIVLTVGFNPHAKAHSASTQVDAWPG
jgi:hypothetical protein